MCSRWNALAVHSLLTVTIFSILHSQPYNLRFEHISAEQGLSHSSVNGMIQDRRGFIWISTGDGLNRYDGYSCKVFRHRAGDPASLSVNWTSSLLEDGDGHIWIGTNGGGLERFDPATETFTLFRHDSSDSRSVSADFLTVEFEDNTGRLWLAGKHGLNVFDTRTCVSERYFHDSLNPRSLSSDWVTCLAPCSDGTIWAGTITALDIFDPRTKQFTRPLPGAQYHGNINVIYEDKTGCMWLATYGIGLIAVNRKTGAMKTYRHAAGDPGSIANDIVYAIFEDDTGYLWLGTRDGLDIFDRRTGHFAHYRNDPDNSSTLSNNNVSVIFRDRAGIIWVGTYGGGINKVMTERKKFTHYKNIPGNRNSLSNDFVFPILEAKDGSIWIGTLGGGLTKFDRSKEHFTQYTHIPGDQNSISHNDVRAIYEDSSGNLWVGTHGGGLNRFEPRTGRFAHYRHSSSPSSLGDDYILSICPGAGKAVWIGTAESGLEQFDPSTGIFTHYRHVPSDVNSISDTRINVLYRDRSGMIWIGTHDGGLDRLDPSRGKITAFRNDPSNPNSISNNDVRAIHEDGSGALWVGTFGGGLNRLIDPAGHFAHITDADGLPNNEVYGILEDDRGDLWISTNKGITRYDPRKNLFRNYTTADGLQSDEFNSNSCARTRDGAMLFGGVNGFNLFYPERVNDNPHVPPVYLTDFKALGKPMPLDTAILSISHITLQYRENFISFEFAALDYTDPSRNRYAYMLEGVDRDWVDNGSGRAVNYSHLDPGEYVFHAKGSNNDGVWNAAGCSVRITIVPPFWARWWFRTLMGIVLLGLFGGGVRYLSVRKLRRQVQQLEKQRALQAERDRISRDLHDHVGAHLASIITGLDMARNYPDAVNPKTKRLLGSLESDARVTMSQLRETIWALNSSSMELTRFAAELEHYARNQVKYHRTIKLDISANVDDSHTLSPAQVLNVFRIGQEALSNALRHAKARNIHIALCVTPEPRLSLVVSDDGKGFEMKTRDEQNGHGLVNMEQRATELLGTFRCDSSPRQGTTIEVQIPLHTDGKGE